MVGFVLTGHGDYATGMASALEMIAGPQERFEVVPFHEGEENEFPVKLTEAIKAAAADGSAVVFCDLLGGTPFNQTMLMSAGIDADVQVVAGTNLPLLLEVAVTRTPETTADEVVEAALEAGKEGIIRPILELAAEEEEVEWDGGL